MVEKSDYVKVAVEPERKERWDRSVSDNPNVGTLSGLVRLAVEREIGGRPESEDMSEDVSEVLSELVEENRQLNNRVQAMEARLGTIEQSVQHDPEVQSLKNDVFAVLPTKDQYEDYNDPSVALPAKLPEDEGGPLAYSGSVADVAALLDSSGLQVQRALDKLQSDTARLQETETHDGELRYFKEV